jgi:hypothetical protein
MAKTSAEKSRDYAQRYPDRRAESKRAYRERNLITVREKEAEYARRKRAEKRKIRDPMLTCLDCKGQRPRPITRGPFPLRCPECREKRNQSLRHGRQHIYDMKPERRLRAQKNSPEQKARNAASKRRWYAENQARRRHEARELCGGAFCVRCGFSDERALTFDHPDGGGNKERMRGLSTDVVVSRVLRGDTGFRVLCWNCNWITHVERVAEASLASPS